MPKVGSPYHIPGRMRNQAYPTACLLYTSIVGPECRIGHGHVQRTQLQCLQSVLLAVQLAVGINIDLDLPIGLFFDQLGKLIEQDVVACLLYTSRCV